MAMTLLIQPTGRARIGFLRLAMPFTTPPPADQTTGTAAVFSSLELARESPLLADCSQPGSQVDGRVVADLRKKTEDLEARSISREVLALFSTARRLCWGTIIS